MIRLVRSPHSLVIAALVLGLQAGVTSASIMGFGDFSEWAINPRDSNSPPTLSFSPSKIQLTNQAGSEARSIFHNTPQDVTKFEASFMYQALNTPSGGDFSGACFVLQNSADGPHAVGGSSDYYGYGGGNSIAIRNSAAISLELYPPTKSGLYTNGNVGGGSSPTGSVDLRSGHPILVNLSYNGLLLHETLTDTITNGTFDTYYSIDLPSAVGGSTAYVGFTASTYSRADQYIWFPVYTPEPATLLLLVGGGMALTRRRNRMV